MTAPLRRLVDRFANEVVLAASAGTPPPEWALTALADLPTLMDRARARERTAERMVVSLAEAAVLVGYIDKVLDGIVVDVDTNRNRATVQFVRPAVVAEITAGNARLGLGDEYVYGSSPLTLGPARCASSLSPEL